MDRSKIYYCGFYDIVNAKYKRNFVLAATTKMDYIARSIVKSEFDVEIISASWLIDKKYILVKGERQCVGENIHFSTLTSFGTKRKTGGYIKIIFTLFVLFIKLLSVSRSQTLFVYHSPWLSLPVRMAKRIKGFRLILEIEEIYADITSMGKLFDKMEYTLINVADGYLLSTDLLKNKVCVAKPSVVIYGKYNVEPQLAKPVDDEKIRLLYAGIIDKKKAGAFNALYATKYLDNRYELRIIGFGDIESLKKEIDEINKTNSCKVYYDGVLNGDEYISYCQKCHIGLATQKMEGKYLESSFPSKILSYMSMGLNVVSGRIECVEVSAIGNIITYYDNDNPQSIAQAISSAKLISNNIIVGKVEEMETQFVYRLGSLCNMKEK